MATHAVANTACECATGRVLCCMAVVWCSSASGESSDEFERLDGRRKASVGGTESHCALMWRQSVGDVEPPVWYVWPECAAFRRRSSDP